MVLMALVGVVGAVLHVERNLTGQGALLSERFIRGAPMLAPLLFANMGALGLIVLLDPKEERIDRHSRLYICLLPERLNDQP